MTREIRVHYYQLTLGPAHLARIRALDAIPGIRCRGVALASSEETRRFDRSSANLEDIDEVVEGIYERMSLYHRIRAAIRHLKATEPDVIIIDAPADPVQLAVGRLAQWRGLPVLTRWAATVLDHPRYAWKEYLKGFVYRGWDGYL
ncbi:MAG: hypothetical protein JRG86_13320, partial [Deltaproteobacteria bacterium]|nr:hypothetical protein [Deltaproteobacteria bacterium]